MLVTLSAALPVLLSVTDCAALVVFSSWLPKLKFVADKLTMGAGAAPVPVRLMVCGLPAMLSVIVTAPVRMPVAVGVNVTLMVQLAPAATDVPQVLVCMKSPLATMLVTLSATFPVLFSVTDCAALVERKCRFLNARQFGETLTPVASPVPVRLTDCGLPAALSVMLIAPVRLPSFPTRRSSDLVQLAPAATDVPQVLVCMKSPLATMLVTLSAAVPVLVSVTVCTALVVFTF